MANKKRHEIQKWRLTFCQLMTHSLVFGKVGLLQVNSSHSVKQVRLVLHDFLHVWKRGRGSAEEKSAKELPPPSGQIWNLVQFFKNQTKLKSFSFSNVPYDTDDCSQRYFSFSLSRQEFYRWITSTKVKGGEKARVAWWSPRRCYWRQKIFTVIFEWDKRNKNSGATFDGAAHKKLRHEIYFFFRRRNTLPVWCRLFALCNRPRSFTYSSANQIILLYSFVTKVTKCFTNGNSFDLIAVVFFRLRIVSARLYPKGIRPVTLILIFERFWACRHFCDTRKKSCCFPYARQCLGEIVDWHQHKLSDC